MNFGSDPQHDARAILDRTRHLIAHAAALHIDRAAILAECASVRRCHPRFVWGGSQTGEDRAQLRERIRTWLAEGQLPLPGAEMWVGPGSGRWCAICSTVIQRSHVEYEIPHRDGWLYVHLRCFTLWKEESRGYSSFDGHSG